MPKMHHVLERAVALIEANPGVPVACLGLAFKANIDDFRESPARFVAASLARRFGERVRIVEPYARRLPIEFTDTGATLVDVDTALETCGLFVLLVDHDAFRSVPAEERSGAVVFDTRGIGRTSVRRHALAYVLRAKAPVKHLPSQKARQKTKAAILTCWPIAYLKFVETPWDSLPKF